MSNIKRAQQMLSWFKSWGVTDVCICPGGRNAPFVGVLEKHPSFSTVSAFDERAAGFFAFGRAFAQQRPSVVITTSGTAAAELLPSVIEAHYTQTPLIVVTADRPHALRGTGSPQVIEQTGLFGNYVELSYDLDWDQPWEPPQWSGRRPLHVNIAFEEPLIDDELSFHLESERRPLLPQKSKLDSDILGSLLQNFRSTTAVPLLIVGPLHPHEVAGVERLAQSWPGLIYAEGSSGLREKNNPRQLISSDKWLSRLLKNQQLSGILRVGGVPTLKLWRELEAADVPVVSLSSRPFAGLARGEFIECDLSQLPEVSLGEIAVDVMTSVLHQDLQLSVKKQELLQKYPLSEPALVRWMSEKIPPGDAIYMGNSLPIREWDDFATDQCARHLRVNRGANGIDGQLASALGMSSASEALTVILGDLTALYDNSSLWFKNQVQDLRVMIINNNGGRIFERLFQRDSFYNSHQVDFSAWAQMWGMNFHLVQARDFKNWTQTGVFEILPDAQQTQCFWNEYDQIYR